MRRPKNWETRFPTKAQLGLIGVINPMDLRELVPDQICVSFVASNAHERGGAGARYRVHHKNFATDKNSHWMDHGLKTFSVFEFANKQATAEAAISWADHRYGKRDWARDPWGSYQDARAITAAWDAVEKAVNEEAARHAFAMRDFDIRCTCPNPACAKTWKQKATEHTGPRYCECGSIVQEEEL